MFQRVKIETSSLVRIYNDGRVCRFYIGEKNIGAVELCGATEIQHVLFMKHTKGEICNKTIEMTKSEVEDIRKYFSLVFRVED